MDANDIIEDNAILRIFDELLDFPAPPGYEAGISSEVGRRISDLGFRPETDSAGNIVVRVGGETGNGGGRSSGLDGAVEIDKTVGAGPLIMASHLDEIALVVSRVEDDGRLRVVRSGGLHPSKLGEGPVTVLGSAASGRVSDKTESSITGVFSFGSTHRKAADTPEFGWEDASIITGHSKAELERIGITVGSVAVPIRERRGPVVFGPENDPLVAAWTFDDRIGVSLLLCLLEWIHDENADVVPGLVIAFTVHEEGGCHGATAVARRLNPKTFIAVDGCPIPPGVDLTLDGRPAVWCRDSIAQYNPALVDRIVETGRSCKVEIQRAVYEGAMSDASRVYSSGGAERVATFGHVRENSHGFEVARVSVFENTFSVLKGLAAGLTD